MEVQVEDRRFESVVPPDRGGFVKLEARPDGVGNACREGDHALPAGWSGFVVVGKVPAVVADGRAGLRGDGVECHENTEKERDWR
jgi:hypothetical protein